MSFEQFWHVLWMSYGWGRRIILKIWVPRKCSTKNSHKILLPWMTFWAWKIFQWFYFFFVLLWGNCLLNFWTWTWSVTTFSYMLVSSRWFFKLEKFWKNWLFRPRKNVRNSILCAYDVCAMKLPFEFVSFIRHEILSRICITLIICWTSSDIFLYEWFEYEFLQLKKFRDSLFFDFESFIRLASEFLDLDLRVQRFYSDGFLNLKKINSLDWLFGLGKNFRF